MSIELTEEQSKAIEQAGATPAVIDPRTQKSYVLLSAEMFDRLKAILPAAEDSLADTYRAQLDSAMRAGWNDPAMDDYNDYDARRKP